MRLRIRSKCKQAHMLYLLNITYRVTSEPTPFLQEQEAFVSDVLW